MNNFLSHVNDFLYSYILIFLLVGAGIYFSIRTRFVQLTLLKDAFLALKEKSSDGENASGKPVSSFQALMISTASRVGTGNIAGIATALAAGGPGAIFWMWIMAVIGGASAFVESTLAQVYKVKDGDSFRGGPSYYIERALKKRWLGVLFSVLLICCFAYGFNGLQAYNISSSLEYYVKDYSNTMLPAVVGAVLALLTAVVIFGGVHRISFITSVLVPIMAGIYIVGSLVLILMNITALPGAIKMIFVGAFNPEAVVGAGAGIAVREAIRFGVARGLFSNEAGMGSTPHAHARAKVENPHKQGLAAMISVFIDTFIILNLTVFSILTTGVLDSGKEGTALTQAAFTKGFGNFGDIFVAVCLLFFAFSTILGWHFFGEVNVKYLFGEKAAKFYSILVIGFVIVGSTLKVQLVWSLSDFFNGLMVIPNAIALWALSGVVVKICKQYGKK